MAARINKVHRVVIAIAIQIQAIGGFGVEVDGIVGVDESAPLGAVISGVAIIQAGVIRAIIAISTKTDTLATANSACLFYHLPRPQSRKSLPGRDGLGDMCKTCC